VVQLYQPAHCAVSQLPCVWGSTLKTVWHSEGKGSDSYIHGMPVSKEQELGSTGLCAAFSNANVIKKPCKNASPCLLSNDDGWWITSSIACKNVLISCINIREYCVLVFIPENRYFRWMLCAVMFRMVNSCTSLERLNMKVLNLFWEMPDTISFDICKSCTASLQLHHSRCGACWNTALLVLLSVH